MGVRNYAFEVIKSFDSRKICRLYSSVKEDRNTLIEQSEILIEQ